MKRIDRYILASFLWAWLVAFCFFIGMYLIIHFFNKLGDLAEAGSSFAAQGYNPVIGFCRYYALNLPFVMVQTAPFTILMGAMWVCQQLSRRNELVSILAAGVSFRRVALVPLVAGLGLSLLFAAAREGFLPRIAAERHRMERLFKGKADDVLKRLPQIRDGDGRIFHIKDYVVSDRTAYRVDIIEVPAKGASIAHFDVIRYVEGEGWHGMRSDEAPVEIDTDLHPRDLEIESRSLLFLDARDLQRMIHRYPHRSDLRLLLHAHFVYPLATLVLLLMGLPLVLRVNRQSPFVAAGVALLLSIAFFAVQSVTQDLGARDEVLNPVLGAWLPIIIFGSVGLLLFETMAT
jgi:lipopolysaccharide export system permease protein